MDRQSHLYVYRLNYSIIVLGCAKYQRVWLHHYSAATTVSYRDFYLLEVFSG